MKILVTGGAGFIGSHVVDAYLAAGHEVVVIDDLSSGQRAHLNPAARLYQVGLLSPGLGEVFMRERPEVLNHHAAQMDVRRSVVDPVFDAEVNVVGLLRCLEATRAAAVGRVIFASSGGAVYGEPAGGPSREEDETRPVSPYGVSKRCGEHYLACYHAMYGLPYVALRYANVYGPRQSPHGEAGVVAIFAHKMLAGEQPVINGDGEQTRDFVSVDDVAAANLAALERDFVGPVNIGTGRETTVNRLFATLRDVAGVAVAERHGPAKPGEQRRSVVDISRARRVLGWQPEVELAEGLRRTVAYFRSRAGS